MTDQDQPIINRVANSPLQGIDLNEYLDRKPRATLDIAHFLNGEPMVREKSFREAVKAYDWQGLEGTNVAVVCTADVIMPQWVYLLVATSLSQVAAFFVFGEMEALEKALFQNQLAKLNPEDFTDAKLVIKGCSDIPVPAFAYMELVRLLRPHAASIMYGEPCSTVPIYKRPRK